MRTPHGACSTRSRRCPRTPYLPERTESPGRPTRPGLSHVVHLRLTDARPEGAEDGLGPGLDAAAPGTKAATGSATRTWPEFVGNQQSTAGRAGGGRRLPLRLRDQHAGDPRRRCWSGTKRRRLGGSAPWLARDASLSSAATASVTVVCADPPRFGCGSTVVRAEQIGGHSRNPLAERQRPNADSSAIAVRPTRARNQGWRRMVVSQAKQAP